MVGFQRSSTPLKMASAAFDYGTYLVTKRCIRPAAGLPPPSVASLESSYQNAYFAQSDAPRACDPRCATKPVRGVRQVSTVQHIIEQSGTTAADCGSTTRQAFVHPRDASPAPDRIPKAVDQKPKPVVFPVALERTRVRGK